MNFIAGRKYRVLSLEELKKKGSYCKESGWIEFEGIGEVFTEEMKPICNQEIEVQSTANNVCVTIDKREYFICPVMCEDITGRWGEPHNTQSILKEGKVTITKAVEIFDIPRDMLGCAFWVEHEGTQEAMLLYNSSETELFFNPIWGDKFVCTFTDYKLGRVVIYPMTRCNNVL